jgi:hypothetical protein
MAEGLETRIGQETAPLDLKGARYVMPLTFSHQARA